MPNENEPNNSPTPPPTPTPTAPTESTASAPSLASGAAGASEWKPYVSDPALSAEENAAKQVEHDKGKPAEDKPAEEKFVPLTEADIKIPEGLEAAPELQADFLSIVNDRALKPAELAQRLVDLQAKSMQQVAERFSQQLVEQRDQWVSEVKAMPDFTGDKLPAAIGAISSLIDHHGGAEAAKIRAAFDLTGAGDHPAIFNFLHKIAKDHAEAAVKPGASPGDQSPPKLADFLYPTMKKD